MNVAWLEAPGLLAALIALGATLRTSGSRPRVADLSFRALLGLLAFNHACNLLEALSFEWADRIADQLSIVVPLLWGLFLLEIGRQYLSERLRASDDQLHFFLENVPAAVAGLDSKSRLVGHSRSWGDLFGTAAPGTELDRALGLTLPGLTRAMKACARGTTESLAGEETVGQEDAMTLRWSVRRWLHPDLPDPGVLLLLEDLTKDREAEAARLAAAEELSRTQRLAEVGQLAAGAAHDFNNFLQIINNSLDELTDVAHGGEQTASTTPERADALQNIARAVESASAMTRTMLHFGRGREGNAQRVDLKNLVQQVQTPLAQALGRRHRLVVSFPENTALTVWGNPRRLEQALLNLTMNARDAMPRGGTIELSLSADESLAQISVRDFGVGMPEEVQAQLFTPFFTTKGTRGTGLGLRVVKSTMDEHKGSVLVESQPGEGTTFRLRIPLLAVKEADARHH